MSSNHQFFMSGFYSFFFLWTNSLLPTHSPYRLLGVCKIHFLLQKNKIQWELILHHFGAVWAKNWCISLLLHNALPEKEIEAEI